MYTTSNELVKAARENNTDAILNIMNTRDDIISEYIGIALEKTAENYNIRNALILIELGGDKVLLKDYFDFALIRFASSPNSTDITMLLDCEQGKKSSDALIEKLIYTASMARKEKTLSALLDHERSKTIKLTHKQPECQYSIMDSMIKMAEEHKDDKIIKILKQRKSKEVAMEKPREEKVGHHTDVLLSARKVDGNDKGNSR